MIKNVIIFNQYINCSTASFSKLSNRDKLNLISIYILLVPISPLYILILQHILLIILWKIVFYRYNELYKCSLRVIVLLYTFYIASSLMTSSSQMISFCIPYKLKINTYIINIWNLIASNNSSLLINLCDINRYFYIELPFIITRSFLITINYLCLYNFILLITPVEQLIICFADSISKNSSHNNQVQDSILMILLSSELISILLTKIKHSNHCLKLRGFNRLQILSNFKYLIQLVLYKYQQLCINSIYNLIYTIYSRELLYYNPELWLIIY